MNNEGADQTARMHRLICVFVVRICKKQVCSWRGSIIFASVCFIQSYGFAVRALFCLSLRRAVVAIFSNLFHCLFLFPWYPPFSLPSCWETALHDWNIVLTGILTFLSHLVGKKLYMTGILCWLGHKHSNQTKQMKLKVCQYNKFEEI